MKQHAKIFPHNDLYNLAYYHKCVIDKKVSNKEKDALALDCMSCLISLAFTVESLINLVGIKKITGWKERDSWLNKAKNVCTRSGKNFRKCEEPYKTIWELKVQRDNMAHGKPLVVETEARTRQELLESLECVWDKFLTPEYVDHAYSKVREFEKILFDGTGLSRADAITGTVPLP